MATKEEIIEKLKTVNDPELGIDIVDLGLIYDVAVNEKGIVTVKMTLTTPGCPLMAVFYQQVISAVKEITGVKDVKVEITFDPPWSPERMSKGARVKLGMV